MWPGTSGEQRCLGSMVTLPPALQLTLTWGASTLWTKRVELPCQLDIAEIGGRLAGDRSVCELRTETSVHLVRAERRLRVEHGELELVVDAVTDDVAPAVPAGVDPRSAAFDLGSLILHGAVGLMLFLLADPLAAEHRELPAPELFAHVAEETIVFGDASAVTRQLDEEPGGQHARDQRAPGAAGPGARTHAARGEPQHPTAGASAIANRDRSKYAPEDLESWSMISLIAHATAGAQETSNGYDAWSGAGLASGPSWGEPGGLGDGAGLGGLSLSGIGEGGGSRGEGVNLGPGGVGTCGEGCTGTAGGRVAGNHRVGTGISLCGPRYVKEVKVSDGCKSEVSGRLPAETIQRTVRQSFGRFRVCYEKDLRTQPSLTGRVTVSFTIARDGSVARVSATGEGVPATTASCVGTAFGGLSFPAPEGGVVNVVYPIMMSPG